MNRRIQPVSLPRDLDWLGTFLRPRFRRFVD